jgi:cob(I)alamin adenosyltransferase
MKIYTRTGDNGTTGLIGGERIRKSDPRLDCSGGIDELNASIGVAVIAAGADLAAKLTQIQHDLFTIGAHVASPGSTGAASNALPGLDESLITRLETEIDSAETQLAPLKNFILPGGGEAAARLHLARAICRRAERSIVDFAMEQPLPAIILTYANRLSDWLFVHARLANHQVGVADVIWQK